MDPRALEIYTDGSSKVQHECKAGCAFVVVYPEHTNIANVESFGFSYHQSKIGAMEIQGINSALDWLYQNVSRLRSLDITSAAIFCDNQYVVESANVYINGWMKNKWKKKDGGDIANLDAWKKFASLKRKISGITIEIKWFKGKTSEPTKKVDHLAKASADQISRYTSSDYMHAKFADRLNPKILFKESVSERKATIRIYYHQPVNKKKNSEYKVYFEIIKKGNVVNTCIAYCTKEFDRDYIDRKNYYRATLNNVNELRTTFVNVKKIQGKALKLIKDKMKKKYGKC